MWSAISVEIPSSEPHPTLVISRCLMSPQICLSKTHWMCPDFLHTLCTKNSHLLLNLPSLSLCLTHRDSKGAADGFERCHCICGPRGGGPWPLEGVPCYTWPFESGGAGTMPLLTLLTGTFGFSESLMWLCERPALTEVRDERVPATVQSCPVLVHWKLNASRGAIGSWACFVSCGTDNEASVSTCRMESWGSLSHLKRAQVTYLICAKQTRDMIWSRGASNLNVLYHSFLVSVWVAPHVAPHQKHCAQVHMENYYQNQSNMSQYQQNLITLPQESMASWISSMNVKQHFWKYVS